MTSVSVTINGRQFRMACDDGQEGHLMDLARELDARIAALRNEFGELGEARLIIMAAITVADELVEAGLRIRRLEEEFTTLQNAQVATSDRKKATGAAVASALGTAADRVESLATRLNQNSDV